MVFLVSIPCPTAINLSWREYGSAAAEVSLVTGPTEHVSAKKGGGAAPASDALAVIGMYGLGVMGQNLSLNIASKGFKISVHNRTLSPS